VREQPLGGRGPVGLRGWTGVATVAVAPRFAHSSAASAKESGQEGHAGGVPSSSTMDRRVVVEWGSEKSRL